MCEMSPADDMAEDSLQVVGEKDEPTSGTEPRGAIGVYSNLHLLLFDSFVGLKTAN